jgi:hypothetical protein
MAEANDIVKHILFIKTVYSSKVKKSALQTRQTASGHFRRRMKLYYFHSPKNCIPPLLITEKFNFMYAFFHNEVAFLQSRKYKKLRIASFSYAQAAGLVNLSVLRSNNPAVVYSKNTTFHSFISATHRS